MKSLVLALMLIAPSALAGEDQLLAPGSAAPTLKDVTWIQGDAATAWQPGQVYVLDFWATWCGPCKASIPHIDALSDARGKDGVHVIGVAIWPRDGMVPTPEFVKQKGDAMSYAICEDIDGKTAATFMDAAAQNGIPTCMVVDKAGKIAWIGHPMAGLEDVVDKVVAGTFDSAAAAKDFTAEFAPKLKTFKLMKSYGAARKAKDWKTAAEVATQIFAIDPSENAQFASLAYSADLKAGNADLAAQFGRRVVAGELKQNAAGLNGLAWTIVDPQDLPAHPDLELARTAADAANTLAEGKDFSILDTLARVVFLQGDVGRAIELQQKAVDLAPEQAKEELGQRLSEYKANKQA